MLHGRALKPRRRRHLHLPPWRTDWLTARLLAAALQRATGRAFAALGAAEGTAGLRVLDLGCGERPWSALFGEAHVIGVDIATEGARPDVVALGAALPFADGSFDLVFTSQVLEHVPDDAPVLAECARTLRPGGALVLSVPFYWPLHEEPHDYRRFTHHGLRRALAQAGFGRVEIEADAGSLTMVVAAVLELLPRRHGAWLLMAPLVLLLNGLAWAAQPLSRDRRSTLNWVATAWRP